MPLFGLAIASIFVILGLWHLYWSFGGTLLINGAIPEIDGQPAFKPRRTLTALVSAVLFGCAALVMAISGLVEAGAVRVALPWFGYTLAAGLLARAVGEFRLVGFFKRAASSRFARLDTLVYSPLCLLLSTGVFILTINSHRS